MKQTYSLQREDILPVYKFINLDMMCMFYNTYTCINRETETNTQKASPATKDAGILSGLSPFLT